MRLPSWEGSGLKDINNSFPTQFTKSSLVRGKWIERRISLIMGWNTSGLPSWEGSGLKGISALYELHKFPVFPREREVDWKIFSRSLWLRIESSLVRGKWIERSYEIVLSCPRKVFPREREVDWKTRRELPYKIQKCLPSWEGSGLKVLIDSP